MLRLTTRILNSSLLQGIGVTFSYCISQTWSIEFLQSFWQYLWLPAFSISWKLLDFLREGGYWYRSHGLRWSKKAQRDSNQKSGSGGTLHLSKTNIGRRSKNQNTKRGADIGNCNQEAPVLLLHGAPRVQQYDTRNTRLLAILAMNTQNMDVLYGAGRQYDVWWNAQPLEMTVLLLSEVDSATAVCGDFLVLLILGRGVALSVSYVAIW